MKLFQQSLEGEVPDGVIFHSFQICHAKRTLMLVVYTLGDALAAKSVATFCDGWLAILAHTDRAVEFVQDP